MKFPKKKKESACNVGDLGSIPGLGRSPGEGEGYPFQCSGLENSLDCIVHGVTKSWTRLRDFHFHFQGFSDGLDSKESACNLGDLGLILGLGRFPGGGRDNSLQNSCPENPHGQRSLQSMGSQSVRNQWVT